MQNVNIFVPHAPSKSVRNGGQAPRNWQRYAEAVEYTPEVVHLQEIASGRGSSTTFCTAAHSLVN